MYDYIEHEHVIDEQYYPIIVSFIKSINEYYQNKYWNKYQKETDGFIYNSGERLITDVFAGRAYYWGDDEKEIDKPNFEYDGLEVSWYKWIGRGTWATIKGKEFSVDFLAKMYKDCTKAIDKYVQSMKDNL